MPTRGLPVSPRSPRRRRPRCSRAGPMPISPRPARSDATTPSGREAKTGPEPAPACRALPGARKGPAAGLPRAEPRDAVRTRRPPGDEWIHEIKFDGYRLQARVDGKSVKLLTRKGLDWTRKFKPIAEALRSLGLGSALLDGELVVEDEAGVSSFAVAAGRPQGRAHRPDGLLCLRSSLPRRVRPHEGAADRAQDPAGRSSRRCARRMRSCASARTWSGTARPWSGMPAGWGWRASSRSARTSPMPAGADRTG